MIIQTYVSDVTTSLNDIDITPDGRSFVSELQGGAINTIVNETQAMGAWDGLAPFADGFLASSPFSNAVWYFYDGQKSLLGEVEGGIADIGTDPAAGLLYPPQLFENTVTAYTLEAFQWTRITTADGFGEHVVDMTFGDQGGQSVAKVDGTIMGNFGEKKLCGTWDRDGGISAAPARWVIWILGMTVC